MMHHLLALSLLATSAMAAPAVDSYLASSAAPASVSGKRHCAAQAEHGQNKLAAMSGSRVEAYNTYTNWQTVYGTTDLGNINESTTEKAPATASSSAPSDTPVNTPVNTPSYKPTTTATEAASVTSSSTYQETVLAHHNVHRANHSASALVWDSELESAAAEVAASCNYAHNVTAGGGGYGQNIAAGVPASNISQVISDLFYNGEVNSYPGPYGPTQTEPDMTNFESWGHFSQIVWVGTTKVACVTQDCTSQGLAQTGSDVHPFFTVCNYGSPGNVGGEYGMNILKSLDKATVTGTSLTT
jgi:uncharacterized protein YkwD